MASQGRPVTEAEKRAVLRMAHCATQKEISRAVKLHPATISRILKNRS